jgi:nucleotide-binding universal stress UspA family protein
MARRQGSELVALFVHTVGGLASMRAESVTAVRQLNVETVAGLRAAIEARADHLGFRGRVVERSGNPALEIVRLAEELKVDAVVVGASTQAGHRLVGSLAVHLVKQAHWPVTVVP